MEQNNRYHIKYTDESENSQKLRGRCLHLKQDTKEAGVSRKDVMDKT
jgi:hypothetical protein